MRVRVLVIVLVLALVGSLVGVAGAREDQGLSVRLLHAWLWRPQVLRIEVGISGLEPDADLPVLTLAMRLGSRSVQGALPPIHLPSRIPLDVDLEAGRLRLGEFWIATFEPIPRLSENLQVAVMAELRQGAAVATAQRTVTVPLPTVIVPGYLNDLSGKPSAELTADLLQRGYQIEGAARTLYWFPYQSRALSFQDAATALGRYVRTVVLPSTYAARINIVGYSLGGLLARWNLVNGEGGWDRLVDRLVLIGVPNEGSVRAYLAKTTPRYIDIFGWGHTPAVDALLPSFPYWREAADRPWRQPPDGRNAILNELNRRPIPDGVRMYAVYGGHDPGDASAPKTEEGIIGPLSSATLSFGSGDGIVLAASVLGGSINGGPGVPGLADHFARRVDLGGVYHTSLMATGAPIVADMLLDRFGDPWPLAPGSAVRRPGRTNGVLPSRIFPDFQLASAPR